MCGTENAEGVQFCAACGSELTEGATQPQPQAPKGGVPAKTMMFGQSPQAAQPEQPAAEAPKKAPARTVLGMPAVGGPAAQPEPAQAPMAKPQQAPMAKPQQAPMAKPQQTQPAPAKPAGGAPKSDGRAHTVLGLPAVVDAATAQLKQAQAAKPAEPAPMARPQQAPAAKQEPDAKALEDKRTVLGMPAMGSDGAATAVASEASSGSGSAPETPGVGGAPKPGPSTEPLEPVPVARKQPPARSEPDLEETIAADSVADALPPSHADTWPDDEPQPRKKGGGSLLIVAIVAAVVVLAGGGILAYLFLFAGGAELKPQVFPAADGKNMTVVLAFPDAPAGAVLQVQGEQQIQVLGGQARFDLSIGDMKLGENAINVVYTEPGSAPEPMTFPILLRHTVREDLTGLVTADPFFDVVFEVAPGIQLSVEGKPVQVASGAYTHRVSLAQAVSAGEGGTDVNYKVAFQLTDTGGQSEQGQHVVTIPVTELVIDRPAADAEVAVEEVTCSGSTEDGAQVTVNGQPVSVIANRFSTKVTLAALGEHQIVVKARTPSKAPSSIQRKVVRLESLADAIAEWSKDLDSKLDYPTLARDATAQNGKKIKIAGRIVNINTAKGRTAFLLYVGEGCPAGARCAVYVAFPGETNAGLQSLVEVYGQVRGTKDVDLRGGEQETMPAIEAKFVVEQQAKKGKKRGKR
jgi:hypothetical protein